MTRQNNNKRPRKRGRPRKVQWPKEIYKRKTRNTDDWDVRKKSKFALKKFSCVLCPIIFISNTKVVTADLISTFSPDYI